MRPLARGLAQHVGSPGWLEETDPAGWYFVRDGRSIPPALTDHALLSRSGADLLMYTKHRHELRHRKEGMAWYSSKPMPSLCPELTLVFCTETKGSFAICNDA